MHILYSWRSLRPCYKVSFASNMSVINISNDYDRKKSSVDCAWNVKGCALLKHAVTSLLSGVKGCVCSLRRVAYIWLIYSNILAVPHWASRCGTCFAQSSLQRLLDSHPLCRVPYFLRPRCLEQRQLTRYFHAKINPTSLLFRPNGPLVLVHPPHITCKIRAA